MTDFVQTMKNWRRLCRTMEVEYSDDGCYHCPLLELSPDKRGCDAIYVDEFADNVDWRKLEEVVDIWAETNPGPVYETWLEFIKRFETGAPKSDKDFIYWMGTNTIPAGIAEKLGIKPKEVNE